MTELGAMRLDELRQMIAAPSSDYSAGEWCTAANDAVLIAAALQQALEEIAAMHTMESGLRSVAVARAALAESEKTA